MRLGRVRARPPNELIILVVAVRQISLLEFLVDFVNPAVYFIYFVAIHRVEELAVAFHLRFRKASVP